MICNTERHYEMHFTFIMNMEHGNQLYGDSNPRSIITNTQFHHLLLISFQVLSSGHLTKGFLTKILYASHLTQGRYHGKLKAFNFSILSTQAVNIIIQLRVVY
jgi:hypothetical protein